MPTFVDNINSQYRVRYVVTQIAQSVTYNRSRVRRTLYHEKLDGTGHFTFDGQPWSISGGGNESGSSTYDFRNYTVRKVYEDEVLIDHDADGGKSFNVAASISMAGPVGGTGTASGTVTLTTIPRTTTPSVSGELVLQNDGGSITISMPRASTSLDHRLRFRFGGRSGTIGTGLGASYTWNVNTTSLLEEIPNTVAARGTIFCDTYSGNTLLGTEEVSFVVRAGSQIQPVIGGISLSENVALVASAIGVYVQGQTRLNYAMTGVSGAAGSTIKARSLTVAGQSFDTASGVTSVIAQNGTITVTATVTDSRNRTATRTQNINVLAWAVPKITRLIVQRSDQAGVLDDNGQYFRVTVTATVSGLTNGTQRNTLAWRTGARNRGASSWTYSGWTNHSSTTLSAWFVIGGSYSALLSYEVLLEVRDVFTQSKPSAKQEVVGTGAVLAEFAREGVSFGKRYEKGALDVGGNVFVTGRLDARNPTLIGYSKGNTVLLSGQWGSLNTAGSSGSQVVNDGFGYGSGDIDVPVPGIYEVVATVTFGATADGGDRLVRLRSNGYPDDFAGNWRRLAGGSPYAPSGQKMQVTGLVPVQSSLIVQAFQNTGANMTVTLENISMRFVRSL